jgi:hypothetical protein
MKQYAASPVIQQLITDRKSYFQVDWADEFYSKVWDVDTAQGFGLDIWGRIVVIGRSVRISTFDRAFGYYEAWSGTSGISPLAGPVIINGQAFILAPPASSGVTDSRITPFDDAPFYDGIQATEIVVLSDEAYRKLVLAKALANISDCSIPSLNYALRNLFDGGVSRRCYATTSNKMDLSYVFEFALTPVEKTLATSAGVIPRPAGVKLTIIQVIPGETFGFAEAETWQPFDQGVFFGDDGAVNAI